MKLFTRSLIATAVMAFAAHASAQITFYESEGYKGRTLTSEKRLTTLDRTMDNKVSSVVVVGQRWQACENTRFEGRCVVLRPGQYPSLTAMGLNDRISSARPLRADVHVAEGDYAPMPVVTQDFRRNRNEMLFDAEVTSAKAVVGTPAQRCWMEREQVSQAAPAAAPANGGFTSNMNLPGAAIGAVIGGILGHQVGGGTGKQIATVGGALGGAALGSQYGKNDAVAQPVAQPVTQDVRRCDGNAAQATPAYWDVSYTFRGTEHRVQMANQPGRTVTVNNKGEPRA